MTKCHGTHACVAAVHLWRGRDNACQHDKLLLYATVVGQLCDCLFLRHKASI